MGPSFASVAFILNPLFLGVEKNILMKLGINSGPLAARGIHQLLSGSLSPGYRLLHFN